MLKTSHTTGLSAQRHSAISLSLIASCLILHPSPLIVMLHTESPYLYTLSIPSFWNHDGLAYQRFKAGLGRQRRAAIASLNSATEKDVSKDGRQRSQAAEWLSRSGQLHTGLASWFG